MEKFGTGSCLPTTGFWRSTSQAGWWFIHQNSPLLSFGGREREAFVLNAVRLVSLLDWQTPGVVLLAEDLDDMDPGCRKLWKTDRSEKYYVTLLEVGEYTGANGRADHSGLSLILRVKSQCGSRLVKPVRREHTKRIWDDMLF